MADSIRKQILAAIKTKFESLVAGTDGYNYTWFKVTNAPMPRNYTLNDNEIRFYVDYENKIEDGYQSITKIMNVQVEFWHPVAEEEIPGNILEDMLADSVKAMTADIYWGGLAINTQETGNDLTYEENENRLIYGVSTWEIEYRHNVGDPTSNT